MAKKNAAKNFFPLKCDVVFKELMRNKTVLRYFISDVLDIPVEEIRSVRLENTFLSRHGIRDKLGILDVRVLLNDESRINIELQIHYMDCWDKRSLFYLSRMYTEDFYRGERYDGLKKCIAVNILGFAGDSHPGYHKVYQLRDQEGRLYSDLLEVHVIELKKELTGDRIDDWIRLINAESMKEINMIQSNNPGIIAAIEEVKIMNLSKWLKMRYELRLKAWRDQKAWEDTAKRIGWDTGHAQGLAEGRAEGLAQGVIQGDLNRSQQDIFDLFAEIGSIPEDIHSRILAEDNTEVLRKWLKAAARARTYEEFRENMQ